MDNSEKKLQDRIERLQELIKAKKNENKSLKIYQEDLQQHTLRYRKILDKSHISLWEEDVSGAYKILESLPCSTGRELLEYLSSHPDTTGDLIRQLKIVNINDYSIQLFEAESRDELLEFLTSDKILTQAPSPGFLKILTAMKDGDYNCRHEITTYTISGKELNLLMTAYLPGRGNGNILISMMDITKRKHNEDALTHTIEQAEEQKRRTEVLQNILLTLTSSLDKEEILHAILREAKKVIPYSCANIRLLENGYLRVAAAVGYDNYGAGEFIRNSSVKVRKLWGAAESIKNRRIYIIPDTRTYPGWVVFPETSFILGYIGVPIERNDSPMGLLSLASDKTDAFTHTDSEKLEPFAHAVSAALQSSNLFELAKDEVRKRKETEASIKKSLGEKEILLREIHHRVKNNLSLIMSLINLQSGMLPLNIDPFIFEDLKQRVYTISLVHERLYSSNNLSSVDLESFLFDLTGSVRSSSVFKEGIEFRIEIEKAVEIEADTLVPLALLLNELIINSVKYAFPDEPGMISITVIDDMRNHKIIFKDNGIGIPENRKPSSSQLGLDLVEPLAAQIGGSFSFTNDGGAVSTIIFPRK